MGLWRWIKRKRHCEHHCVEVNFKQRTVRCLYCKEIIPIANLDMPFTYSGIRPKSLCNGIRSND